MSNPRELAEIVQERLFPWQREWIKDTSTRKIINKARQIGYSTAGALEGLIHCMKYDGHVYYFVSNSVTQARVELLNSVKDTWIPIFDRLGILNESDYEIYSNRVDLSNGSRLTAETNVASKLRGKSSASFVLDEFSHWSKRNSQTILDAIDPIVDSPSNPHSVIRIISTPLHTVDNKYADIWKAKDDIWSRHKTIIPEVLEHPHYTQEWWEDTKKGKSSDQIKREYLGQFLDTEDFFFSEDELDSISIGSPPEDKNQIVRIGIDVGMQDRTSLIALVKEGEDYLIIDHQDIGGEKFKIQRQKCRTFIEEWQDSDYAGTEVAVDATAHPAFAEELNDDVSATVYCLHGDRQRKIDRTHQLKSLIEQRNISFVSTISSNSSEKVKQKVCSDLRKVAQDVTSAGNVRFRADRDSDGHADAYDALLLALQTEHEQTMTFLGEY